MQKYIYPKNSFDNLYSDIELKKLQSFPYGKIQK